MTFLPIVVRELRLASRRRATYWLRSAAALAVMLGGTWLYLFLQSEPPKSIATALFCVLTGGAALIALLSGPRSTADCISCEKREGTLGLLFLTDLKGYDVVLGKLVAGSLNAFYTVVAMLPMMAIPLLLGGGVTLAEFGRMALVIVDALFFSLTLGICVSAVNRSAQKAAAVSSLLVVFFAAGLPACGAFITAFRKASSVSPLFLAPSVGYSYYLAFDNSYKGAEIWFWVSLGVVYAISLLSLIVASWIAPVCWQDRPMSNKTLAWRARWLGWTRRFTDGKGSFRERLLGINPVYWLLARSRSKQLVPWLFLWLVAVVWLGAWWKFRKEWLNEGVYLGTAALLNLVLRYWFAGEATRALADYRRSGALELLLSTPLKIEDILRGQWLSLMRQFLGPLLAILAVEFLFMLATAREAVPDEDRVFWFALWIGGILMLVADLVALYWVGMWQGLTARNPLRAAGASLTRVLVVPWIGFATVLLLVILNAFSQRSYQSGPSWKFFLGLWFGLGVGADLLFGAWSRQKLLEGFRLAAQQPYEARRDFWKRWFGTLKPHVSGLTPAGVEPGN